MSHVKDSLYGFVIGDAIGVPIEFVSREKLLKRPVTDMLEYGSHNVQKGVWSDDTSMTLATMDSIIITKGINYYNMANCFCDWLNYAKYTATGIVFDVGITTKKALLKFYLDKKDATMCGGVSEQENGNGSLMRMLPIALYCYYKKLEEDEIYEITKNTSSITHAHEISILGCYIYVYYILFILNGNDKQTSYKLLQKINYYKYFNVDIIDKYKRILKEDIWNLELEAIKSTGYVVDTLEAVIWVILNTDNFNEAIIGAINLGDDTDTIGAITGSIAGFLYGYNSISKKWLKDLQNTEYLDKIINNFEEVLKYNK